MGQTTHSREFLKVHTLLVSDLHTMIESLDMFLSRSNSGLFNCSPEKEERNKEKTIKNVISGDSWPLSPIIVFILVTQLDPVFYKGR